LEHQVERFHVRLNDEFPIADNTPNEGIDLIGRKGVSFAEYFFNALEFFFVGFASGDQRRLLCARFRLHCGNNFRVVYVLARLDYQANEWIR
jgi:hypothetical protein